MRKNERNEELQSRREFFKKAAKGALPILGAVVLANTPLLSKAAEATGCTIDACTATCMGGCKGACSGCSHSCSGSCMRGCTSSSRY